jgi:hypothetical protein
MRGEALAIAAVGREQPPQAASKLIMVRDIQGSQDLALRAHQLRQRRIDCLPPGIGQLNQYTPTIIGMILPRDEPAVGEPVHPIGHSARRDEGFSQQLSGRKAVGRTRASQRGQHVELPGLKIMGAECVRSQTIEVMSQSGDTGENLHRRHIEVGAFAAPGFHNRVDLVRSRLAGHTRSLDVKTLDVEICRGRGDLHTRSGHA